MKGATLIGSGPEILTKVSMVGHDLKLDNGIGTCGKEGQSVPVGVGLPTIKSRKSPSAGRKDKDLQLAMGIRRDHKRGDL